MKARKTNLHPRNIEKANTPTHRPYTLSTNARKFT